MEVFTKFGNSGKTIVFLPGGGVDVKCFLHLLKKLAEKNTIYAINYALFTTKDVQDTLTQIRSILTNLDTKEIVLVGHSFGADLARALSTETCVTKAILLNPSAFPLPLTKTQVVLKTIAKSVYGGLRYPKSFFPQLGLGFHYLRDLYSYTSQTKEHTRQAVENIINPQLNIPKTDKMVIVYSDKDDYFPLHKIPEEIRQNSIIVKGNHDWLLNDINFSADFLLRQIQ